MPERWDDATLAAALTDLASQLELPARDRLVDNVLAALPAYPRKAPFHVPRGRRVRWAIAVVVLAAIATLGVSPDARAKVRDWFGAGGVRIEQTPSGTAAGPPATQAPDVPSLGLGNRTTMAGAAAAFGAPLAAPHREGLRDADEIYYGQPPPDGQVSMLWHPDATLRPSAAVPDIAILFSQFRGSVEGPIIQKTARSGTRVQQVTVRGGEGWWLEGEPHEFGYLRPDGMFQVLTLRLAGNTLVWTRAGITYRLESSLSLSEALEFAGSVS